MVVFLLSDHPLAKIFSLADKESSRLVRYSVFARSFSNRVKSIFSLERPKSSLHSTYFVCSSSNISIRMALLMLNLQLYFDCRNIVKSYFSRCHNTSQEETLY